LQPTFLESIFDQQPGSKKKTCFGRKKDKKRINPRKKEIFFLFSWIHKKETAFSLI
jgi:hypothetical protein